MPAAILGRMSVGEKLWMKPDGLAITVPPKGSRARRDEDNARVDSGPTVSSEPFINTIKTPDDAGVTLSAT